MISSLLIVSYSLIALTTLDATISFIICWKTKCPVLYARLNAMNSPRVFFLILLSPLLFAGLMGYLGLRVYYANQGKTTEEINKSIAGLLPH